MKAARALVGHFNGSSQANALLLSAQVRNTVWLTVMQDVVTRWWSTYKMVERLLILRPYFTLLVAESNLHADLNLTHEQWETLVAIAAVLKPFMVVQKTLEGSKYVTLSLVPYLVTKVRKGLQEVADGSPIPSIRNLAHDLLYNQTNGYNIYWGSGADGTVFHERETLGPRNRAKGFSYPTLIAASVDPRMKSLKFFDADDRQLCRDALLDEMRKVQAKEQAALPPRPPRALLRAVPRRALNAQAGRGNMYDDLESDSEDNGDRDNASSSEDDEDEVAAYKIRLESELTSQLATLIQCKSLSMYERQTEEEAAADVALIYTNPLSWFKENESKFRYVAAVAKRFLCIPATSAPSERVFSTAGLTISKQRASLNPDNAADLIFLHDSWELAERFASR
jgi:hypothetical protein